MYLSSAECVPCRALPCILKDNSVAFDEPRLCMTCLSMRICGSFGWLDVGTTSRRRNYFSDDQTMIAMSENADRARVRRGKRSGSKCLSSCSCLPR